MGHLGGRGHTCNASLLLQTAAWGTLGTLRTFLSFSVEKDVQRLLRAIAGQGEPLPLCTRGSTFKKPSYGPRGSQEGGLGNLDKWLWNVLVPVSQVPQEVWHRPAHTPCELSHCFHPTDEETGAQGGEEAHPRS